MMAESFFDFITKLSQPEVTKDAHKSEMRGESSPENLSGIK